MTVSPLTIYLAWHPAATAAAGLAAAAYGWFHAPSDDLLRSGLGLPVYFRSQAATAGGGLPRDIDVGGADLNVVVVLAEAHMVADPAWTAWLDRLARQAGRVQMIPVALHDSAYRMPESLRRLNFLRVDERGEGASDEAGLLARRTPRLLRQLTEIIGRELALRLAGAPDGGMAARAPAPLTLFLSHAKRDGVAVAEALRAVIQDHNRLRAFFDDADLPVGHAFASELERAAQTDSAAMIAVITDAYAARPWCRREVALARTPRPEPGHARCWNVRPLLVVDALQGAPTRTIPELGSATVVRWQPDRALHTVDLLMLEVLLGSYHRLRARLVPPAAGRHVISWPPEALSLLALQRAAGEPVDEVVYPGHALPEAERAALATLFPKIRLLTFEDATAACPAAPDSANGRLVGLSLGFHPDLGAHGLGREHFDELMLRVTRCVIESGGHIAFGGMLRTSGLTETLLTLARTLVADDDSPGAADPVPRVLSYQRWPAVPDVEQIAADVGVCEYVLVDSPLPAAQRLKEDRRVQSPERARQHAHALSAMRRAMTPGGQRTSTGRPAPPTAARVAAGGLRTDFNGLMPGVIEEVLYALEARQPVFLLGGFGGGAALVTAALLANTPAELDPATHRQGSALYRLTEQGLAARGESQLIGDLFQRLHDSLQRVRGDLAAGLGNGLDDAENRRLMQSDHVSEIVDLLRLCMRRLWGAAA